MVVYNKLHRKVAQNKYTMVINILNFNWFLFEI